MVQSSDRHPSRPETTQLCLVGTPKDTAAVAGLFAGSSRVETSRRAAPTERGTAA